MVDLKDQKIRAPRNQTLSVSEEEKKLYKTQLLVPPLGDVGNFLDRVICGDVLSVSSGLPRSFVDLLIIDPPYNLTKTFGSGSFREMSLSEYEAYFERHLIALLPLLKATATLYVCGDWNSSAALHRVLERHVIVRNRITWEREKGRGAKTNWKNASEDIWFSTVSDRYHFDVDAVKLKRRVIAPYRENGAPKGWQQTNDGDFRLTHPSNLWTDVTVPFWSMPENTDHPTQKPEKLIGKLILASSRKDDVVFDPFLGSGTTAAVARKLGRRFVGVEMDETYCCMSAKRIAMAEVAKSIQGYSDGVFWERNSLNVRERKEKSLSLELSF